MSFAAGAPGRQTVPLKGSRWFFILSNTRFQTKMMISFSFIMFLTISIFTVFLHLNVFPQLKDEITYSNLKLCVKTSESLDNHIEKIDDITKKLISNKTLMQILTKANSGYLFDSYEKLDNDRRLSDIVANTIALTSLSSLNINVFSDDERYTFIYNKNSSNLRVMLEDPYYVEKLNQKKLTIYHRQSGNFEEEFSISFVRPFYDVYSKKYGYVEVEETDKHLKEICNIGNVGDVIIADERNQIVYVTSPVDQKTREFLLAASQHDDVLEDESGNIYFCSTSSYSGLTTYVKYDPTTLYSSLNLLEQATYIIVGAVTLISLLLMFFFSQLLVKPLRKLRNNVLQVSYQNMGIKDFSTDNDEIVLLGHAFQNILEELKISIDHEIASSKAESEARLVALQAQIAPHFIHNVLYTISIAAQEVRTGDVVSMCKQLSDMLRYTVNSSAQTVRLEEEMRCIDNYLSLQAKNYEEFLEYEVSLNQRTKDLLIPRLSLQPFVENIFQHAFKASKPPYRILILTAVDGDTWSISISDNGSGMSAEQIEKIYETVDQRKISPRCAAEETAAKAGMCGMGIINSICRLKMIYGDDFNFSIFINETGGTTVRLEGPFQETGCADME